MSRPLHIIGRDIRRHWAKVNYDITVSPAVLHHYRRFRAHQLATYSNSNLFYLGVDQREFTGGGAAYGCHAESAYLSAKSHVYFMSQHRSLNR